jgi:hypothetical protein
MGVSCDYNFFGALFPGTSNSIRTFGSTGRVHKSLARGICLVLPIAYYYYRSRLCMELSAESGKRTHLIECLLSRLAPCQSLTPGPRCTVPESELVGSIIAPRHDRGINALRELLSVRRLFLSYIDQQWCFMRTREDVHSRGPLRRYYEVAKSIIAHLEFERR